MLGSFDCPPCALVFTITDKGVQAGKIEYKPEKNILNQTHDESHMLIYLCDDALNDMLQLKHYLTQYSAQRKLDFDLLSFSSGDSLLAAFQQNSQKPELIFLDVFLSDSSGIESAKHLREMHYQGDIIFTSTSAEHAMDSYEVNALYYLQKLYGHRDFENAMSRCVSLRQNPKPCFSFVNKKQKISVPYEDILFFETEQSHTIILHAVSGVHSFRGTLRQVESFFEGEDSFLPIGRSYLVNLGQLSGQSGNDLLMSDGSIVQVPFRKQKAIITTINAWQALNAN